MHASLTPSDGDRGHRHLVEFYDTDAFLVETVAGFVGPALSGGDTAIVVATAAHREAFETALRAAGVDLDTAFGEDRYVALDAAELLASLIVDGMPDPQHFHATVGALLERAAGSGARRVRVYGEMVALLLSTGEQAAAIALEDLWNAQALTHEFELLCAYPMAAFEDEASAAAFKRICEQHGAVIPSESYSRLGDADARSRAVARLQQENAALRAGWQRLHDDERDSASELAQIDALEGVASFGFGLIDLDLRFVRVNRAFAAMNAITVAQHRGLPVGEILPELWPQLEPALEQMLHSGRGVCTREYVGTRPAVPDRVGTWLHTFYPVHADGELVGIGFVVLDVTEQRQSEKLCAVIMQTMAEGLVAFDGAGQLTLMNGAAEQLLGWTEDELRGSHLQDLVHCHRAAGPAATALTAGPLAGAIRERRAVREVEESFVRRDGRILPVVCSASPEPSGGVVIVFSDATERIEQRRRMAGQRDAITWVARIREALDEDRLELYSQPILPLAGGAAREELFLRMITRDGEVVPAGAFIPAADELGLVVEIDRWVISRAVRCAALGRLVHINLSAASLADAGLLNFVAAELRAVSALASNLVLEVTEAALLSDAVAAELFATGLRKLGCGLVLDDFGTGSGSFAYLERVPVEALKIDRDFVRDLPTNAANQHLVQAIVALARRFGHATVACGVEDKQTLTLLREYGVDYAQGYDISQPAPVAAPRGERRPARIKAAPRAGDDRARLLRGRLLDYREAHHGHAEPDGLVWRRSSAPARR